MSICFIAEREGSLAPNGTCRDKLFVCCFKEIELLCLFVCQVKVDWEVILVLMLALCIYYTNKDDGIHALLLSEHHYPHNVDITNHLFSM